MEYLAGHASWGVWRIWRCGLKWERKRISHIGQITFILGAEGLYQEIFTASKLLHLKAKQHELQDSGACGMHVARVNGMWAAACREAAPCPCQFVVCCRVWAGGWEPCSPVSLAGSLLHIISPQALRIGSSFSTAFLHHERMPERHWLMWIRQHHPTLQIRTKITRGHSCCSPPHMDSPSGLAHDLDLN